MLLLASKLFELAVRARHLLYDRGWRKVYKSRLLTLSVGNIVCGGSGKTPFTIMLARQLMEKKKVAILSRGYRSLAENSLALMSDGRGPLLSANEGGDEPYLMAKNLPGVIVLVGKDRVKSARWAEELGAEILLLDDGMQHRRLYRDEEIVIIDGSRPFGPLLPRGKFRDIPARLKGATLIVVNRADEHFAHIKQQIRRWSDAPIIACQLKNLSLVKEGPVAAFCALGNPESFFSEVEKAGGELRLKKTLPDHKRFSLDQLKAFAREAEALGAKRILCSEKDWVKLEKHDGFSLPLDYLKCEMKITCGTDEYDAWSAQIGEI